MCCSSNLNQISLFGASFKSVEHSFKLYSRYKANTFTCCSRRPRLLHMRSTVLRWQCYHTRRGCSLLSDCCYMVQKGHLGGDRRNVKLVSYKLHQRVSKFENMGLTVIWNITFVLRIPEESPSLFGSHQVYLPLVLQLVKSMNTADDDWDLVQFHKPSVSPSNVATML